MKLLWHFVFKLSECGVLVCEAACRVHCPPVFPAAVAPSPSCPTCSTPARTHSLLPSPFFSFLGVSLARLGEIIFVGTLLQLASHKSAVGACLFSQHTFWHHTHTHTHYAVLLNCGPTGCRSPVFTLPHIVPSGGLVPQRTHIPGTE